MGDHKVLRVVGYCRVSTVEQVESGLSLDRQRSRILSWCDASGNELVEVFEDHGVSGSQIDPPGRSAALELISSGEADVLVCVKLDRLTRSLVQLVGILESEVPIVCILDSFDLTTATGRLIAHVLGAVAEFERSLISERTREALAQAKLRGVQVGRKTAREQYPELAAHADRLYHDLGLSVAAVAHALDVSRGKALRLLGVAQRRAGGAQVSYLPPPRRIEG